MDDLQHHEMLLGLLKQTLGSHVEWVAQAILNQQDDYLVLLVRLRHPSLKVLVKLAGPKARMAGSFERTAYFHRLVRANTSLQLPEIMAADESCHHWPWRYLVREYLPGQLWASAQGHMNPDELEGAYRDIGSAVAQLHTIQFAAFGELTPGGDVLGDQSFLPAFIERARRSIRDTRLYDWFLSLLSTYEDLFAGVKQPTLTHEDLHGYNLVFQHRRGAWKLATILDFDKAWAGHREIDLARMQFWRGTTGGTFWSAYDAYFPRDPLYEHRLRIYQLLWCFEYARNTPRHLADTRMLCLELGVEPPERFQSAG